MTQTMHRSDQVLQATVADELLFMPTVDSHLRVSARDGVVTLEGEVASVPERMAAAEAAEHVWGVRRVVDHVVVRSAGASASDDTDLARSATSMLEWSIDIPLNAITVEVADRKIRLTGVVTWDYQREAAARAVRSLRGITDVRNDITINESPSVSILKDGVEAAIRRNLPLDARAIAVEIHGHKVTLTGSMRSSTDRRRIEYLAWSAAGVSEVENNIVLAA